VFSATDPTGGAGMQADILTLASMGCHPLSVITAITVQDTLGVDDVLPMDADWVADQARCVLEDMVVAAFKIGVIGGVDNVAAIAEVVSDYPDIPLVLDPVLASGRGDELANEEVVVLEARRHSPNPDRANDVSVVLDLMIHDIDLVLELAGAPVVSLAAAGGRSAEGPIDYVNATLGFANGVVASLTASKMAHRKIRSLSAHCRRALVETDFLNRSLQIHRRSHQSFSADHGELLYRNDGFIEEVSTSPVDPLVAELEHFLQCVRGEETPAVVSLGLRFYPKGYVPKHVYVTQHMGDNNDLDIPANQKDVAFNGYTLLSKPAVITDHIATTLPPLFAAAPAAS